MLLIAFLIPITVLVSFPLWLLGQLVSAFTIGPIFWKITGEELGFPSFKAFAKFNIGIVMFLVVLSQLLN